jgi:glucosamine--fructose-6-phosphate aminotransferase (isomerizing)
MNLRDELKQQPGALRNLVSAIFSGDRIPIFDRLPPPETPLLTGMGASYHAGLIAALHLRKLGIPTTCIEAVDLLNYSLPSIEDRQVLLYISQSGSSGEVDPILDRLSPHLRLISLTNDPQSPLALVSRTALSMAAGEERLIAGKTYLNSLAVLWLLARTWGGAIDGSERSALLSVADQAEMILAQAESIQARFLETFGATPRLLFLGHGPHAVTAREAAMTISEWAKLPALHAGIGAYRHGLIESISPGQAVVIFAAAGATRISALSVANELSGYQVKVLLVENGRLLSPEEASQADPTMDEFLSPLLDIIPIQLYADALASAQGIQPGFRHISKVVTRL